MQDIVGSIYFSHIDICMIVVLSHALVVLMVQWYFKEEIGLSVQGRYS